MRRVTAGCLAAVIWFCASDIVGAQGTGPAWEILAPLPINGSLPSTMGASEGQILVASGQALWVLDPQTHLPLRDAIGLPFAVDSETRMSVSETLCHLLSGEGPSDFYRVDLTDGTVTQVVLPPGVPDSRRVLDVQGNRAYVAFEGVPWKLFELNIQASSWRNLDGPGIPPSGQWARGFMALGDRLVCWPDHHTQGYILDETRWGAIAEFGVLPSRSFRNGGMLEADRVSGSIYLTHGDGSRLLLEYRPLQQQSFCLRPRLPFPLTTRNDNLFLLRVDGVQYLYVYFGTPTERLARIPVGDLERITQSSPLADIGLPWQCNFPNGFRSYRTPDARGVMGVADAGPLGHVLYTFRRGWMRIFMHLNGGWKRMRDIPLKESLQVSGAYPRMGVQAASGPGNIYYLSGNGTDFIHLDLLSGAKSRLAYPPMKHDRIMAMTVLAGLPWLVVRNATSNPGLTLMRYVAASDSWSVVTGIPSASTEASFLGLEAVGRTLIIIHGNQVTDYDVVAGRITAQQTLPLKMPANGGMAARDGSDLFLIGAGGPRTIKKLDLQTRDLFRIDIPMPDKVFVYGDRAVIGRFGGRKLLLIAGGHDTSELWSIDPARLNSHAIPLLQ